MKPFQLVDDDELARRLRLLDEVFDSLDEKESMAPTCGKQSRPASSCRRPTSSGRYSEVTPMARSGPTWKTRRRLEAKRDELRKPNAPANRTPASGRTAARASVKVLARPAASNRVPPLKGLQATGATAQHPVLSESKGQAYQDFRERRSRSTASEEMSSDPRSEVGRDAGSSPRSLSESKASPDRAIVDDSDTNTVYTDDEFEDD